MSISTHVLDAVAGAPAPGMSLRLERADGPLVGTGRTDADGRCPELTEGLELETGVYRLRFDTGDVVRRQGHRHLLPHGRDRLRGHRRRRALPRAAAAEPVRLLHLPRELIPMTIARPAARRGRHRGDDGRPRWRRRAPSTRPATSSYADGRIESVGAGPAPHLSEADRAAVRHVDASGCLVTPGLVNTHHHLYQWVTRGLAVDAGLFEWLTTLYPVWSRLDEDITGAAAAAALGWLARTGCTTTMDHHYVFPTRRRRPARRRRSRPRAPSACGSCRPVARWTSARPAAGFRRTTWCRTSTRSSRTRRPPSRPITTPGPTRCCASASRPARRSRSARSCWWSRRRWPASWACACTPTSPRPRTRRPTAASGSRCRRWTTSPRWAGSVTTSGSRTGSTSTTPASPRSPPAARVWRTARRPTPGWARACAG